VGSPPPAIEFGPFRLDTGKRVLWRDDRIVPLPPKALDVLVALVEEHGDVVTKETLLDRVWPDTFVEEANLSVNISTLRKMLGEADDGQSYIQTVPRRGYRFAAAHRPAPAASTPTLAVLPFKALGGFEEPPYLGLGMADALITRLSRVSRLLVRSTSAVLKYASAPLDAEAAGRELRVDAVLDGTIQRDGNRLRVTVRLVPLAPGVSPWADTFEEEFTNIFAVQDAAAERVARALALRLAESDVRLIGKRHTDDVEAYQAFLKGRYFWSRFTEDGIEKAFQYLQEAAEKDPNFALPHAGLADAYLVLGFSGLVSPSEAWPAARGAAERALELDPDLADAQVSLAYVKLFQDWDWKGAGELLERAVAQSPNSAAVHQWYALYLDMQGRFAEAAREIDRAGALDPLSIVVHAMRVFQAYLARDFETELRRARQTVELDPNHFLGHWCLGLASQHNGRIDEAVEAHRKAASLAHDNTLMKAVLARSLALAGRRQETLRILGELETTLGYASPYQRATVELALGQRQAALAALEAATADRDPWVVWVGIDPMLDEVRAEPRLDAVVKRVFRGEVRRRNPSAAAPA
jgi:DNA-binding winged helix-turn-helix (wHTH) protein/tetratricopeptide (TPR) repeat protein